nr:MAG TPA: major capsid protein [Caudoviricetes sp.]
MTINYIKKDGGLFDQKINQGLLTSILGVPEVNLVNGGKSFTLTTISTSGLQAHSRSKGFNSGTYSNDKEVYTMGQDRDVEFYVDTQDVDETNQDLAVSNISKVFIEEQVQPEIDAYRFSKMATDAGQVKEETLTVDNVYTQLKAALLPVRKYGAQNIIGFVSSEVMDFLERSKEFTRSITNQNVGTTALESRVTSIDGVQLVEVWDDTRFKTEYDFSDGYKPKDTAKNINFILVAKQAVIPVVKENAIYLFAPGQHTEGDGYLYQNRLYHDLFIKKQKEDGVSVSLKA